MSKYAVQTGEFSGEIQVGRVSKNGTSFVDKENHTDMVLAAVAQYVQRNFDGGLLVTFPGLNVSLQVKVSPLVNGVAQ